MGLEMRTIVLAIFARSCVTHPGSSKKWTQHTVPLGTRSYNG
jgi:hypothetical protein